MHLVSVRLTLYEADDCKVINQQELLDKRIIRLSNEAYVQGTLLTQADMAILLAESTKTIMLHGKGQYILD